MAEEDSTVRLLLHPAIPESRAGDGEAAGGVALDRVRLTDRHCLGVVLQGAALLAHLDHGGWFLPGGWDGAWLTDAGLLHVPSVRRGRSATLVQVALGQLLRRLFRTEDEVAGRGEARAAARYLTSRWQQVLMPSRADLAVAEIFESAPFLWQESFATARLTLAGEHVVGDLRHLWVAGPGAARRRFLRRAVDLPQVVALLSGAEARDRWDGWRPGESPMALATGGKWQHAVVAWRRQPPENREEAHTLAQGLVALGRYSQALDVLKGQNHRDARLLRARVQVFLGELNAAQVTVRQLSRASLSAEQTVELADVAIRMLAARGQTDEIREWAARALGEARGQLRLKALIIAAGAEWDCEDRAAMDRYLEAASAAVDDPALAGSWHHMRGLRSLLAQDGPDAVEHVSAALRLDRRRLSRAQAGRLWNDLAVSRVQADDLPGAERAARHALRLQEDCDGPSRTTLALYNLAEVRLRRGRCAGVEPILELSTAENRRSGNHRSLVRDLELWVRLELAQGRASAALARCSEALLQLDRQGPTDRRGVFEIFAARAHGWLGRRQRAAACLDRLETDDAQSICELELEERPAVWALAGYRDKAREEARGTRWARLWTALAAGTHPAPEIWDELRRLEGFRAARLVFDCELVLPGVVPPYRLRQAITALRECGAEALAEKLECRSSSPWRVLESYVAEPTVGPQAVRDLLAGVGYGDVDLKWIRDGEEEILMSGIGGAPTDDETAGERLTGTVARGGTMVLRSAHVDAVLRTLFALIRRDLEPAVVVSSKQRPEASQDGGIIGESVVLLKALQRLDRLAGEDLPILILGESGTGKELAARRAHQMSRRREGPFLAINSAALPASLIESELFGHVKGSFTGADRNRPGLFEAARSGTVFLDEIGDLPLVVQGHLLRVLQEGEVQRVGESFARKVDVRVITATHRDLEDMVRRGTFRRDLFFRLKVATIVLPPLRERGDDILLLADHCLALRGLAHRLSDGARSRLLSYRWPGNVRELQNVLEVAMTLTEDRDIRSQDLDLPAPAPEGPEGAYHQLVLQYRKDLVLNAMSETGGNRAAAARRLGLTRQALSYLVKQLGLS